MSQGMLSAVQGKKKSWVSSFFTFSAFRKSSRSMLGLAGSKLQALRVL
jgi:hypothetical protein